MSDLSDKSVDDTIAQLEGRQRDLELDAVAVKSKLEEVRDLLALLQARRRRPHRRSMQLVSDEPGGDAA